MSQQQKQVHEAIILTSYFAFVVGSSFAFVGSLFAFVGSLFAFVAGWICCCGWQLWATVISGTSNYNFQQTARTTFPSRSSLSTRWKASEGPWSGQSRPLPREWSVWGLLVSECVHTWLKRPKASLGWDTWRGGYFWWVGKTKLLAQSAVPPARYNIRKERRNRAIIIDQGTAGQKRPPWATGETITVTLYW